MIHSLSEDGAEEVSLRLARFPERGDAHVWLHVALDGRAWSLADEGFRTEMALATAVDEDTAEFHAQQGARHISFHASQRHSGHLRGRVSARVHVAETRHPELGPGAQPLSLNLTFHAHSPGFKSPSKRWEMTGRLVGTVEVSGNVVKIDHVFGKWHEQTGPRARFAPAFTYLNVQNPELSLLAIGFDEGAAGYAMINGETVGVVDLEIDPAGEASRNFDVTLSDQRRVKGRARVVQTWSVPIEGKRRPGSSVLINSNFGDLVGTLNDWVPPDRTERE